MSPLTEYSHGGGVEIGGGAAEACGEKRILVEGFVVSAECPFRRVGVVGSGGVQPELLIKNGSLALGLEEEVVAARIGDVGPVGVEAVEGIGRGAARLGGEDEGGGFVDAANATGEGLLGVATGLVAERGEARVV